MTFYQITCDNEIIYDPRSKDRMVLSPVLNLEVGKNGSLSFIIPKSNPGYNLIALRKSVIKVYQITKINGKFVSERLFRGTAYSDNKDFFKRKQVECEGELSFLNDSIVRKYEWGGSVENYLKYLISSHNAQVDGFKQFAVRNVTVKDNNDYITRENENYPSTKSELEEKLIDNLGGHFETEEIDGVIYLDYLEEYTKYNSQPIVFGRNLLDLKEYITAENVKTRLIGLGAKDNDTGEYLKFDSINNGKDYVEDKSAIALFGIIEDKVEFNDVTVASNLLNKTKKALEDRIASSTTIELSAADLHAIDVNIEALRVGRMTRVISLPHNLDKYFLLSKMTLNLDDLKSSSIVLGATFKTLTQKQIQQEKKLKKENTNAISIANTAKNTANKAQTTANEAKSNVETISAKLETDYITVENFNSLRNDIQSTYVLNTEFNSLKSKVEKNMENIQADYLQNSEFEKYKLTITNKFTEFLTIDEAEKEFIKYALKNDLKEYLTSEDAESIFAKIADLEEYLKNVDAEKLYAKITDFEELIKRIEILENKNIENGGAE